MSIPRFCMAMAILFAGIMAFAPANAAVLEVTHTPGSGQYASVTEAVAAAAATGDTIRIIDNSAPFEETVLINKVVTVEGDASLDPRPTILGQCQADIGGYLCTLSFGDAYPDGCVFRNLIFKSIDLNNDGWESGSSVVVLRHCFNTVFENCEFDGEDHVETTVTQRWYWANVFNNCTLKGGQYTLITMGGTVTFNSCLFEKTGGGSPMMMNSSDQELTATFNDCTIDYTDTWAVQTYDLWGENLKTFNYSRCLFIATASAGVQTVAIRPGESTTTDPTFNIDNCDFVRTPESAGTTYGILMAHTSNFTLTDSIFYNLNPGVAFWNPWGLTGGTYTNDYNVFQGNEFNIEGFTAGEHTTILNTGDPLYVDAAAGNYKLLDTSVAATYSSGNTAETWAGSQGVLAPYEVTADPTGAVSEGGTLTLTGPADGTDYYWEKDGEALSDDAPRVTGTTSQTLSFTSVEAGDAGVYTVYFNDGTGVQSASYTLEVSAAGDLPVAGGIGLALASLAMGIIAARRARRTR